MLERVYNCPRHGYNHDGITVCTSCEEELKIWFFIKQCRSEDHDYILGNVMHKMQGRCNPQLVSTMIREYLKFGNSR